MRSIILFVILTFSLNAFSSEIKIKVSGMVCSMCAQGVQKKFSHFKAIKNIDVDMDNKVVLLKIQDGQILSDEVIRKVISEAGYNVAKIERN